MINLAKRKNLCYTGCKEEDYLINWCKILTEERKRELKNISDEVLSSQSSKKLIGQIDTLSGDDEMVELYTGYSKREMEHNTDLIEAKQAGIEEGIKKGTKEGKIETAKNMIKDNLDISLIIKYTGLSEAEIKSLIQ